MPLFIILHLHVEMYSRVIPWVKKLGVRSTDTLLSPCLLYTSDAADEEDSVDLGGRRIIKKKKK